MTASDHGGVSQRESTLRNPSQRECVGPAPARAPVMVPDAMLDLCATRLDAVLLCVQLSRLSHDTIRAHFGIDKGHFSRMLSGRANFDERKVAALMELCGNLAPLQWEAKRMGYALVRPEQMTQERPAERAAPWARVA